MILAWLLPAHYSLATASLIEDQRLLPWPQKSLLPLDTAKSVTSGCPVLPREGSTLVYSVHFANGTDADLGSWKALRGNPLAAIEEIAAHMPSGIPNQRFSNPIGNDPLNPDCLRQFGSEPDSIGIARLFKLLGVTDVEQSSLRDRL
jgi:hypothetical protein